MTPRTCDRHWAVEASGQTVTGAGSNSRIWFLFRIVAMAPSVICLLTTVQADAQSKVSLPAEIRHTLKLTRPGGYVELPPDAFGDLSETTIEAWVKWNRFDNHFKRASVAEFTRV